LSCMFIVLICLQLFFFQAEDDIRDLIVTGVQTCALPILAVTRNVVIPSAVGASRNLILMAPSISSTSLALPANRRNARSNGRWEIGRASCRERVKIAACDGRVPRESDH